MTSEVFDKHLQHMQEVTVATLLNKAKEYATDGDRLHNFKVAADVQAYLEMPKLLDARIRNKLIEKQQWKDIALGITANMDGERVQSSGSKNKLGNAVERCVDIETEIGELVDNLIETKKEVIRTIEQLYSPIEYDVLHKRYIQYMTLQEIADHYGRNYDWAKITCKRGCKHVQVILNRKEKQ